MVVANIQNTQTDTRTSKHFMPALNANPAARGWDIAGIQRNTAAGTNAGTTKRPGQREVIAIRLISGALTFAASLYRVWKMREWWIFDLDALTVGNLHALTVGDRYLLVHPSGVGEKSMGPM